jgi:hypothetical protein
MNMLQVKSNLESGKYRTPDAFAADTRLIFSNCYLYGAAPTLPTQRRAAPLTVCARGCGRGRRFNGVTAEVSILCRQLEQVFEREFAKLPAPTPEDTAAANGNGGSDMDSDDRSGDEEEDEEEARRRRKQERKKHKKEKKQLQHQAEQKAATAAAAAKATPLLPQGALGVPQTMLIQSLQAQMHMIQSQINLLAGSPMAASPSVPKAPKAPKAHTEAATGNTVAAAAGVGGAGGSTSAAPSKSANTTSTPVSKAAASPAGKERSDKKKSKDKRPHKPKAKSAKPTDEVGTPASAAGHRQADRALDLVGHRSRTGWRPFWIRP